MIIKFIVKRGDGCSWHRLHNPLKGMVFSTEDNVKMGVHNEDEDPEDCDIYMFNRDVAMSPEKLLELKRDRGFKIVCDVDDYWVLYPSHYLYKPWNENKYGERMLSYIRIADLVTTTTDMLREQILPYNPNVIVQPNTIVPGSPSIKTDKTRFIYVGGITHLPDVELLKIPFQKAGQEPYIYNNAEFTLAGYHTNPIWDKMGNIFKETRSYKMYSPLQLPEYMKQYDNGDVSLIPLKDNTFNNHKSELKVIEAASRYIPCIVSNVYPYKLLKDAPGILWVNNNSDWLKHIRYCIKNPTWVKEEGTKLHNYVQTHYNTQAWSTSLYNKLKELCDSSSVHTPTK